MTGSATECGPQGHRSCQTPRLDLRALTQADLEQVHALHADAELWTHLPSGRHVDLDRLPARRQRRVPPDRERLGLRLVRRGADRGNPDSDAVRLVFADQTLDDAALRSVTAAV